MNSSSETPAAKGLGLRAYGAVENFFLAPCSVYPIVFLRLVFGMVFVEQYLSMAPYIDEIFGPQGVVVQAPVRSEIARWAIDHHRWVYAMTLGGASLYLLGIFTRVGALAAIVGHILFMKIHFGWAWGDANVGHAFLLFSLLGRGDARLSLRAWLALRRGERLPTHDWMLPLRFVQLQVTAVYWGAGYNRLGRPGWHAGRMTFNALNNGLYTRFPTMDWMPFKPVLWAATHYTQFIEISSVVFLWIRRTRIAWAFFAIALHFGLEVGSTLGAWQWWMMFGLSMFLPHAWFERLLKPLERRWMPAAIDEGREPAAT